jgi:branched-chain amino acid transport system substrate-binding protein
MKNKMVKGKRLGIILAVGLAALLLLAACAPAPTAKEEKVVKIGLITDLTGPVSTPNQVGLLSLGDGLKYWNEEIGIPGVAIEMMWRDSKYDQTLRISNYHRYVEGGAVAMVVFTSPGALKPLVEMDEVPMLAGSTTGDLMYPPSWVYSYYPTEAERFAVVADWIMENWREERPPRIAFAVPEVEYTMDALGPSKQYAEGIGMEWLPTEFIPYLVLDSTVQLLRLRENGADFVYIGPTWTNTIPILRDAERLGLLDEIGFCGMESTLARSVVAAVGPLLEGYFVPKTCPAWSDVENPGIRWAQEVHLRYHGTKETPDYYEESIIRASAVLPEAIKRAIEKVGYENLDGRAVNEALETLEDFDPYGYGTPVTYTDPEVRRGSGLTRIYQVQGGEVVTITDWQEAPILWPVK